VKTIKLKNEHILVTGGAAGIGAAIVLDAVQEGAKVSFCDIDIPSGEEYARVLSGSAFDVFFHYADVGNFESLNLAHGAMVDHFGPVTGVVNNAGVNAYYDPVLMTNEQWEQFFNVDLKSVWHTAKCVLPGMRTAKRGSIVNIASIHAPKFFPLLSR
jgi:NAD(P)-dependent dehydrogenase (short-subunit alcohol dehydrogenase family)